MNKLQEIYEMVGDLVLLLTKKRDNEEKGKRDKAQEHTEGQLYEATYILNKIEEIIFRND